MRLRLVFNCEAKGVLETHDADLFALGANEPDFGYSDAFVDPRFSADEFLQGCRDLASTKRKAFVHARRPDDTP